MSWGSFNRSALSESLKTQVRGIHILSKGCCSVELQNAACSYYGDRSELFLKSEPNPEDADVLVVAGWIDEEFESELKLTYQKLRSPRYVMVVGACAISGAPYIPSGQKIRKTSEVLPVDAYVPGCPPRPESILKALSLLGTALTEETKELTLDALRSL